VGHRCSTELRTRVNGIGGQADLLSTTFSVAASGAYRVGGEIPPNVDRREVRMGIRDGPLYFFPPDAVIVTSIGVALALVGMFTVAAAGPTASGVKMTAMVQVAPAASFGPQTFFGSSWNCDASPSVTVKVTGPIVTALGFGFSTVTTFFTDTPIGTVP
jgi:hypothetical protein